MTRLIPADALVSHIAFLGKTGAGKTTAAKGEVERFLSACDRVCIIDPTGVWWGLRLNKSGKGSAFDVAIFGGRHADIELTPAVAEPLAREIGRTNLPAILDTSLMSNADRSSFFTKFAEALFRENDGPLHLVIDEAHLFAPQRPVKGQERMLGAANELVSGGRSRGFRIMLLSQRAAKLHKDSLTQVETLVAMRLIAPQDRDAVKAWVGEWADKTTGADLLQSLPSLDTGEAWVWSPELDHLKRGKFGAIKTFDSSAAPKLGAAKVEPKTLADIDLSAIRAALEAPPEAKPGTKRKANGVAPALGPADVEAARSAGYAKGRAEGYRRGVDAAFSSMGRALIASRNDLVGEGSDNAMALQGLQESLADHRARAPAQPSVKPRANGAANASASADLTPYQVGLLEALAYWRALGREPVSRMMVAAAASVSPKSSTFDKYLSALSARGLIERNGNRISLTSAGVEIAPEPNTSRTVRESLSSILTDYQQRMIDALPKSGAEISRDELADRIKQSAGSSTFQKYLSTLSSFGLVNVSRGGGVAAEPWIFASLEG